MNCHMSVIDWGLALTFQITLYEPCAKLRLACTKYIANNISIIIIIPILYTHHLNRFSPILKHLTTVNTPKQALPKMLYYSNECLLLSFFLLCINSCMNLFVMMMIEAEISMNKRRFLVFRRKEKSRKCGTENPFQNFGSVEI